MQGLRENESITIYSPKRMVLNIYKKLVILIDLPGNGVVYGLISKILEINEYFVKSQLISSIDSID